MHKYSDHKYFEQESKWNILGFLDECVLEPFERKIECYIKCLETIADTGESIKELGSTVKQSIFDDESKHAADRGMDVMEQLAERGRQHAAEAMVYGQAHGNTTGIWVYPQILALTFDPGYNNKLRF